MPKMSDLTRQRLAELADFVEKMEPDQFDMAVFFANSKGNLLLTSELPSKMCGSVACLAGAAAFLSGVRDKEPIRQVAKRFLGITHDEADYMFCGDWSSFKMSATQEEAVAYLRNCLEIGYIIPPGTDPY